MRHLVVFVAVGLATPAVAQPTVPAPTITTPTITPPPPAPTGGKAQGAVDAEEGPTSPIIQRLLARSERIENGGRFGLRIALMGGAMNYTDSTYVERCAERGYDGYCDEWENFWLQEDLGWEVQGGLSLFAGVRLNRPSIFGVFVGYAGMVTATQTSVVQRHMIAVRATTGLVHIEGGAGIGLWHVFGADQLVRGFSGYIDFQFPFGTRGFYLGLPITVEMPRTGGWVGGAANASVSGAIGWGID